MDNDNTNNNNKNKIPMYHGPEASGFETEICDIITTTIDIARLHKSIDDLASRYSGNDAILSKLSSLVLQLPTALSNYEVTLQERTERKNALSTTADEFIEQFLSDDTNKYYYNSAIDLFFAYNRNTMKYELIEEDEIVQVSNQESNHKTNQRRKRTFKFHA